MGELTAYRVGFDRVLFDIRQLALGRLDRFAAKVYTYSKEALFHRLNHGWR
jgi:hypothetical protein